jgi:hypothetical protein
MTFEFVPRLALLTALAACVLCLGCVQTTSAPSPGFVYRQGDRLLEDGREFRFLSFNIPNLHYVEDDMRFDEIMPFRLPDDFEINDALATIDQVGGQVVRMYALSVRKDGDPDTMPRHILGPNKFNEAAFVTLDKVIAAAHRHHVRVIIPFIDQHSWWGGTAELAGFRNAAPDKFWTDPQVIADYKAIVTHVLTRVNTVTGLPYRDDPTILAWETGNELKATDAWTKTVAAHIKSLDRKHLVIDGADRPVISDASLKDPNIDFVQTHHYEKDPRDMLARVVKNSQLARGHKPYHLGEFGFLGTEGMRAVMDTVIREKMTGALIWSLRYRTRDGGFYWHHEPFGGDLFKAYHWPGFPIGDTFDERGLVRLLRAKAYEIRHLTAPALPPPPPPHLTNVSAGGLISWQGTVGTESYDVQRAPASGGGLLPQWTTIAEGVSEAQVQYRPLFVDETAQPGASYRYRLIARNESGASAPSNEFGPVTITHRTLVDELSNTARIFLAEGKTQLVQNDARKFKEDCHRLAGEKGTVVAYFASGDIQAARIFAFTAADQPNLKLSISRDGRNYAPIDANAQRTVTYGGIAYGFWMADLYTVKTPGPGYAYLRIEFESDAQLSRVEIDHG